MAALDSTRTLHLGLDYSTRRRYLECGVASILFKRVLRAVETSLHLSPIQKLVLEVAEDHLNHSQPKKMGHSDIPGGRVDAEQDKLTLFWVFRCTVLEGCISCHQPSLAAGLGMAMGPLLAL